MDKDERDGREGKRWRMGGRGAVMPRQGRGMKTWRERVVFRCFGSFCPRGSRERGVERLGGLRRAIPGNGGNSRFLLPKDARATAAAKRIPSAAAYPEPIDDWLDKSGEAAIEQRAERAGVEELVQAKKDALYAMIAPRAGFGKGKDPTWDDLVDRVARLEGLEVPYGGFEKGFEPDWKAVKTRLERLRQSLLQDDVSEDDANQIARSLLDGFKALVVHERNGLTTLELNERLNALRRDSLDAVQKAITEEMARMAAEMAEQQAKAEARTFAQPTRTCRQPPEPCKPSTTSSSSTHSTSMA